MGKGVKKSGAANVEQAFTKDVSLDAALTALHDAGGDRAAANTSLERGRQLRYGAAREMLPLAVVVRRQSGERADLRSPKQQWESYLGRIQSIPKNLRRNATTYKLALKQTLQLTNAEFRGLHVADCLATGGIALVCTAATNGSHLYLDVTHAVSPDEALDCLKHAIPDEEERELLGIGHNMLCSMAQLSHLVTFDDPDAADGARMAMNAALLMCLCATPASSPVCTRARPAANLTLAAHPLQEDAEALCRRQA